MIPTRTYEPYFRLEKENNIAIINLSRPEKRNTIASSFWDALIALQDELVNDRTIRVVVILADGKHFSAGTDLDDLKKDRKSMDFGDGIGNGNGRACYRIQYWQRAFHFFEEFDIPVIAGIHGACLGSAIEFIAAADVRIASENSYYFMGEVKTGMCTDLGGTTRLTRILGRSQAMRLLLTAEKIDAQEALRIGLVDKVVSNEDLREATMDMARTIAKMSPFAVMTTKRIVNVAAEGSVAAALAAERVNSAYVTQSNDRLVAMKAMVEEFRGGEYNPTFNLD